MNCCKEIVLLVLQHIVAHGNAGRNKFGYAAFDECLGKFGVFQLVTDSHTPARTNQLGQIDIESMMGETGHLESGGSVLAVVAAGQGYAQYLTGLDGILCVCLVKISAAEQQYGIGMFLLEAVELPHHRRLIGLALCHLFLALTEEEQGCNYEQRNEYSKSNECCLEVMGCKSQQQQDRESHYHGGDVLQHQVVGGRSLVARVNLTQPVSIPNIEKKPSYL